MPEIPELPKGTQVGFGPPTKTTQPFYCEQCDSRAPMHVLACVSVPDNPLVDFLLRCSTCMNVLLLEDVDPNMVWDRGKG
jgi:hypothetical protein